MYKTKYINLKNQLGETKIALTKENTEIVKERFINNSIIKTILTDELKQLLVIFDIDMVINKIIKLLEL